MNNLNKNNPELGLFQNDKEVKKYYKVVKENTDEEEGGIDANVFRYLKSILPEDLKGQTVIDVGCGDARWSEYMLKHNADKVYALDKDSNAVNYAKKRKKNAEFDNLQIIQGDMKNLPIQEKTIDKALASFSLMYFDNLDDVILEVSRALKNDGEFYITTNLIEIKDNELKKKLKGKKIDLALGLDNEVIIRPNIYQPLEQYKEAFDKAGFTIEEEKYFEPEGVSVSENFENKDKIELKKVVFKLLKSEDTKKHDHQTTN